MASPLSSACGLLLFGVLLSFGSRSCYGFRTLRFAMHHRYSDPVKGIMGIHDLPAKGSREYYVAMSHRDRLVRGRGLAGVDPTALTFATGNDTYRISSLGSLYYANVSVGTPPVWFLVALDTGSNLFWLPCNCTATNCVHALQTPKGKRLKLNIYDPHASSTSKNVLCNSTICRHKKQCPSSDSSCEYQVRYRTRNTSSTGVLVEDVMRLSTDDDQTKEVEARINFGCGIVQTGFFLTRGAPNGLFGLGISNISVPSILAQEGLTSNSFSMCFGDDGVGRIRFGDNGSSDQRKTPINIEALHPSYNITITQIIVGEKATDSEFNAIFDSGSSFTYLNDPAYTNITSSFNSMVKGKRYQFDSHIEIPFEYCYENTTSNQTSLEFPSLNLKMKGGDNYYVIHPLVYIAFEGVETVSTAICLGIVKDDDDVNTIGQNFMTGYHIVFDRDNMLLGWKNSSCYDDKVSNASAVNTAHSPAVSPASPIKPKALLNQSESSMPNHSFKIKPFMVTFLMVLFPGFAIF
ncbi:aspartyl protease family protein 1-like [Prosopis cineraria]|uniref:aspartyl protease family protein 1-like n=1 Tax=Prosopis cineraria TaxID=364024 RepID=UPI00240EA7EA|nr:aspartyl protease family protein 1-like [Prosopis cineraria]